MGGGFERLGKRLDGVGWRVWRVWGCGIFAGRLRAWRGLWRRPVRPIWSRGLRCRGAGALAGAGVRLRAHRLTPAPAKPPDWGVSGGFGAERIWGGRYEVWEQRLWRGQGCRVCARAIPAPAKRLEMAAAQLQPRSNRARPSVSRTAAKPRPSTCQFAAKPRPNPDQALVKHARSNPCQAPAKRAGSNPGQTRAVTPGKLPPNRGHAPVERAPSALGQTCRPRTSCCCG